MLGGDPNGLPFHKFCYEEWKAKYGIKPPWSKKDYSILAAAYKTVGDDASARSMWTTFLANSDPFNAGHSPGKFAFNLCMWSAGANLKPKPDARSHALTDLYEARAKILRQIESEPEFSTETERRNEYVRRVKELDS